MRGGIGGITGRYIPGDALLHRLDERAKLFGFLILIAAVIMTDGLWGYLLMAVFLLLLGFVSGLPVREAYGSVWRLMSFYVIVFLMNALFFTSQDPLWHWGIFTLSREGMIQGANVVFRIAIVIVLSNMLMLTTSAVGIMTALEALVRPLKYLHLPAEEIAMILSIALQFIPTLLEESDTIRKAQIARGARFESRKLHEKAMAMIPMIVPIFLAAFRRADELSVAMEARGYRGAKNRTAKKAKGMTGSSWAALLVCAAICAAEVLI